MAKDERPEAKDQPEVEEAITEFDGLRLRSGFLMEEMEPGVLNVAIFGPIFEVTEDNDPEDHEELETEP